VVKKVSIEIKRSDDDSKIIYCCVDLIGDFCKLIHKKNKEKKFRLIAHAIFRNITTKDIFEKYKDFEGTCVLKLEKGGDNTRLYCKLVNIKGENKTSIQKIIIAKIYNKKEQVLSKKSKGYLKSIQKSEYEYKSTIA